MAFLALIGVLALLLAAVALVKIGFDLYWKLDGCVDKYYVFENRLDRLNGRVFKLEQWRTDSRVVRGEQ
jgi:hypothetical protein